MRALCVFLLLISTCLAQTPATTGVIDVQTQQSCVAVTQNTDGTMDCNESGEASVITLGMSPGSILEFEQSAVLPAGEASEGTSGCKTSESFTTGGGQCYESTRVSFNVEASQITMSRALYGRDLEIPYAYAGFHSKSFRRVPFGPTADLSGKATAFIPYADDFAVFYPTVRIDNIVATSSQTALIGTQLLPGDQYKNWGESDLGFTDFTGTLPDACQDIIYTDDFDDLRGSGRVFFSYPWATSSAREYNHDKTEPGNYDCKEQLCCGAFPGQLSPSADDLNKCPDATYCMERATWCDMNLIYYGDYGGVTWMNMDGGLGGDMNRDNYDDDDDDDSCGDGSSDDENDSGGICDFASCGNSITDAQKESIASKWCDCDGGGFDECSPNCYASGPRGDGGSTLDINLSSKQGGRSRRFGGEEDAKDDDNDDENTPIDTDLGDGGKICTGCESAERAFCPEVCMQKFAQDLIGTPAFTAVTSGEPQNAFKTHPACRMLRGAMGRVDVVYVGIDDGGDTTDINNTGMIYPGCVQDCLDTDGCNPIDACINEERAPLYDDTDNDEARRNLVDGPWRLNWVNGVVPGLDSRIFTNHPNAEYTWYNAEDNIRLNPPDDDSFGSLDDDSFCTAEGLGDQYLAGSDYPVTYVAECPGAVCIPNGDFQPDGSYFRCIDDDGDVPPSFLCPHGFFLDGATASDVRRQCQRPYPRYEDDYSKANGNDGNNPDGMHPADAFDYDPKPATVCPLSNFDRMPIMNADQRRFVDHDSSSRIAMHNTAEAFALYGPFCYAEYMAAYGQPEFVVRVTRTDLSPDPLPPQVVTVTVFSETTETANQNGADVSSFYGVSDDGTMFVRLKSVSSVDGSLGVEMDEMLVTCNATFHGGRGAPAIPYNMAGATVDPAKSAMSPWPAIQEHISCFFEGFYQTVVGHGGCVENSGLVALLPIPQILFSAPDSYDPRDFDDDDNQPVNVGIKQGSGWFTVSKRDQATYGEGFRQIGMKADLFANAANAERACSLERFAAVPGMIPGFDFTIQQRNYDSDIQASKLGTSTKRLLDKKSNNFGYYERYLRDRVLTESTPAIVFGRMMEFLSLDSCSQVISALSEFAHLPSGYMADTGDGPCGVPTMHVHNGKFYFQDPTVNNAQTTIILEISQADGVFLGTVNEIMRGVFVDDPIPVCGVAADSSSGRITISAQNVGALTANFLVTGTCDNDVAVTSTQILALDSQEIGQFTLLLSHGSVGRNVTSNIDFTCTLVITNPGAPDPTTEFFDSVTLDNCLLTTHTGGSSTSGVPPTDINICTDFAVGCGLEPGTGGPTANEGGDSFVLVCLISFALFVASAIYLWACLKLAVKQDKKYDEAKIQKMIYTQR